MKKLRFLIPILVLTIILVATTLTASAKTLVLDASQYKIAPSVMTDSLKNFLGVEEENPRIDRTAFAEGEKKAGEWLKSELSKYVVIEGEENIGANPRFKVETQEVKATDNTNKEYIALNIIGKLISATATGSPHKQVVIGANYDNTYSTISNVGGTKSSGALENGTGVATTLALAKYFIDNDVDLGFDIVFVFFCGGTQNRIGSHAYVGEMGLTVLDNTLLMANITRIGGDYVYTHYDEVDTKHEDFISDKAQSVYEFKQLGANKALMSDGFVGNLSYSHWGLKGDHTAFFQQRVNTVNFFGGNYETMNLGNIEAKGVDNISNTDRDTFLGLETTYPDYNVKMAAVAEVLINSITDENFATVMKDSFDTKYNYDWLNKPLFAYIVLAGIIIILVVILIVVVKLMEKKYPFVPKIKKLKIAIFGMDYEDKNSTDIYVDLKKKDDGNPFDGY